MADPILPLPIIPGIRQDLDRTLLPLGSIIAATGVRVRKGSVAQVNGMVDAAGTAASGGPAFAGPCDALGYAAGREVAVMAGHVWARANGSSAFQPVGRAARARPVKAHWAAFTDVTAGVTQTSCAALGSFRASAYFDGSVVRLAVTDQAGIRRASASFSSRTKPRIFVVGTVFVLVMAEVGGAGIYGATIHGTTLAVSAQSLIASRTTNNDTFDAAPFNSTLFLLAYRATATGFSTDLIDLTFAQTAFQSVVCNNATITQCSVYGTDGEGIWSTFDDSTNQKVAAFADDLTSTTGGPTAFAPALNPSWPASMTRRTASTVWMVYTEITTGPLAYTLRLRSVTTGAVTTNVGWAHHVRPASRPWGGTDEKLSMWVHSDNGLGTEPEAQNGWATQRRYTLVTLAVNSGTPDGFGMFVEPELSPDERSSVAIGLHLPEVAFLSVTDENGASVQRGYFPGLATIRTQSTTTVGGTAAFVLYEWETESGFDARARQVAEVGGQGVVFGGGLQEIPSARLNSSFTTDTFARGVENGFLYSPTILKGIPSAGAGLTTDTLYQFVAVFEYITADGLRTRSAPSNIVAVTPTGANLRVTLSITTAPTTEREFSSPPNATAVHVYATTGGGTTYQRVTPDSGLPVGRGATGTNLVTYIHSTADATAAAQEPLYSDGGKANQPAPAHRFGWAGGGRAWVGGLFNPQIVECSKPSLPNEPTTFTRDGAFRCLLPEACTAGAWLDNANVLFTRTGMYLLSGVGPDLNGSPGVGVPQRLPSTVGCVDHRSIVEVPAGLGFQSRRGYEILPRGFGEPRLISAPVQDALRGRRVISATVTGNAGSDFADPAVVGDRLLVLFAIDPTLANDDPGVRLVFDLDLERWISIDPAFADSFSLGETLTTWEGRLVAASRSGTNIRIEDPADWGSVETVPMSVTLADARPFGVLTRGYIKRFQLLGEVRAECKLQTELYIDGVYSDPVELDEQEFHDEPGDKFLAEWEMPERDVNAVGWKFTVESATDEANEGVVLHAIGLEGVGLLGRPRTGLERRA